MEKRPRSSKSVFVAVSVVAIIFLAAGAALGLWSVSQMRELVVDQFNEQQLVIARHTASLIERQFSFLKRELLLLRKPDNLPILGPEGYHEIIQGTFHRVVESGVWKIEIIDLRTLDNYIYMPSRQWSVKETTEKRLQSLPSPETFREQEVWVSATDVKPYGIGLVLVTSLPGPSPRLILFNLNISWFLTPFARDVRSGKTGYVWLIDEQGTFVYHPNTEFVGKSAFEIRGKTYPDVPLASIEFIQREKMMKGETGTGSFYSGWHRGITGKIKKLIAYSPVTISENPPQRWSIAVVAPTTEIEESFQGASWRLFFLQGLVILVIVAGAAALLFFEVRWSRVLEERVNRRTEELKKSEERYRSLVESAEDFIFTVDAEGRFQSMNSFTASFFGGRAEEFLGKSLSSLFQEKIAEKQLHLVRLVFNVGKSVRDEFEIQMGEHRIWLAGNFMPLKNEEGAVNAVLCIARDITENKSLERKLINAEKLASMGTLAAGVAHEVNNPLGVMLGFCDLLLRRSDKSSQEYEDLKTIERQGLHCKQVVENLLSFARLGEGGSEYADLNGCLSDIIKVVKHTLDMHDIVLVLSTGENLPRVDADSRQLQQVFLNLINNAISAMPTGGTLKIRTFLERPTRKAVIQFQDDGIGIKEEDMDHIFEPFFTTKPEGEGTGLGLFVSYGIITKYGGTIDCVSHHASSVKPRGTIFTIKLPTTT
jgi:two-component system NtrC family sensor kinase